MHARPTCTFAAPLHLVTLGDVCHTNSVEIDKEIEAAARASKAAQAERSGLLALQRTAIDMGLVPEPLGVVPKARDQRGHINIR